MRNFRRLGPLFLLFVFALMQFGCGSTRDDFVAIAGGEQHEFAPVSIAGQVVPGVFAANVPVTLRGEDGTVLAETTTDNTGAFLFRALQGPPSFEAVATFPDGLLLRNRVDDNQGGRFVVLNIPTTLAAKVAESGGLSPSEGKARTAKFLGLEHDVDLEYGLSELDPRGFSHLKFFLLADANGGVEAYLGQLSEQAVNGNAFVRFALELADLEASLEGVPTELSPGFRQLQQNPALSRAITADNLRRAPFIAGLILDGVDLLAPTTPTPEAASNEGINGRIVSSLLEKAGDALLGAAWSHIADALNLNYGDSQTLNEIQEQLSVVLNVLSNISLTIDRDALQQAIDDCYTQAIVGIETNNTNLAQVALTQILANPETPYTPSNDNLELLTDLQTLNTENSLSIIRSYVDPNSVGANILVEGKSFILTDQYAQDLTQDSGYFPFRTNDLLNQILVIFDYYSQYQQLGINLLGESAHIQDNPTLALGIAQTNALTALASIYRQRGVVPPSRTIPNNVMVDIQGGLMWYVTLIGARSTSDCVSYADSFTLSNGAGGVYDDWRLPTAEECRLLRDRARLVDISFRDSSVAHDGSDASAGNFGYSAQGLTSLGVTNANILNSDGSVTYAEYLYSDPSSPDSPPSYGQSGLRSGEENTEFRFNHENTYAETTFSERPFLMVRSLGKPVVPIDVHGLVGVDDTDAPIPFTWNPVSAAEFEFFGRLVGSENPVFLTPENSTNQVPERVGASLVYEFSTGGDFTISGDSGSTSRSGYPRRVHNSSGLGSYPTYNGPNEAYTGLNSRAKLISFSVTNTDLDVTPTGRILWKGTDGHGAVNFFLVSTIYNNDGTTQTTNSTIEAPDSGNLELLQVQMFPRNREYILTSIPSTSEQYYCLAFYSDDTVEDVTSSATWTLVDDETGQPVPVDPNTGQAPARFSTQTNGLLILDDTSPEFLRIEVSIGGSDNQKGQTVVKVVTQ